MKKYGQGEIVPEDDEQARTAATNWTDQDREALAVENDEADAEP